MEDIILKEKNLNKGFSLLEILVVITIFSILAVLTTRGVFLTLRGSRKSESMTRVRENLSFALAVMERNVRNADSINPCPNPDTEILTYKDDKGQAATFSCEMGTSPAYIASGSARLTNENIDVTSCSLACEQGVGDAPDSISIDITAKEANLDSLEGAQITVSTKVFLRVY